MEIPKKLITYIIFGLGLGSICFISCLWIFNGYDETLVSVTVWLIASALYGLSFVVFEIKSLPLATFTHLCLCIVITLAARLTWGLLLGQVRTLPSLAISTIPIFIPIYIILFICVLLFRKLHADVALKNKK